MVNRQKPYCKVNLCLHVLKGIKMKIKEKYNSKVKGIVLGRLLPTLPSPYFIYPNEFLSAKELKYVIMQAWLNYGSTVWTDKPEFVFVHYNWLKMIGCAYFDKSSTLGEYTLICMFDEKQGEVIWRHLQKVKKFLEKASQRIKQGQSMNIVMKNLYEEVSKKMNKL